MLMNASSPTGPFRAVLLDLDGTLMDTIPDIAAAANAMRVDLGLPTLPVDTLRTFVGKGTDNLIMRTLSHDLGVASVTDDLFARGRASFYPRYHEVNGLHSVVYPGVREGLRLLNERGLKLAIVTNKPTEFTLPLLKQAGFEKDMLAVVCGDTLPTRKPLPDPMLHALGLLAVHPAESVAIGDSVNDALAARAAGCAVLAVPYGYNEGHDVQDLDVDAIVSDIEEAAQWILARNPV